MAALARTQQGATGMAFDPGLTAGDVIDNDRLCQFFKCGPQGGMRRSNRTNSLVLVSNHVKSIYDDRWVGDTFHYTGMGAKGDQSRKFMQNRTLDESGRNGVEVHLFEVHREQEYRYQGRVQLAGPPYQEDQLDADGANRKVWVFPLKLVVGQPVPLSRGDFATARKRRERKARHLDPLELERRANAARPFAGQRTVVATEYERDPNVSAYAKYRAKGHCQLCLQPAPFKAKGGEPYLETHHIEWLAKGGKDTRENTVALCPNCHRRMHVIDDPADRERLKLVVRLSLQ